MFDDNLSKILVWWKFISKKTFHGTFFSFQCTYIYVWYVFTVVFKHVSLETTTRTFLMMMINFLLKITFPDHFTFCQPFIEPYVMKLLVDLLYLNMYQLSKWENYPSLFSKYSRYLNKRFCVVSLSRTFRKLRVS